MAIDPDNRSSVVDIAKDWPGKSNCPCGSSITAVKPSRIVGTIKKVKRVIDRRESTNASYTDNCLCFLGRKRKHLHRPCSSSIGLPKLITRCAGGEIKFIREYSLIEDVSARPDVLEGNSAGRSAIGRPKPFNRVGIPG